MTDPLPASAVYGVIPPDVMSTPTGARQMSPLAPGSAQLEAAPDASLDSVDMLAPPGVLERRYVLAQALRALRPGGRLTAAAPKTKGGARLADELAAFGGQAEVVSRRHHKICTIIRPAAALGLDEAIARGGPQTVPALDMWSQPGIFSWDRLDPGSRLLIETLPALKGAGADLGAGVGVLARAILASPAVTALGLVDIDRRAVEAARRNVDDPRVRFEWADLRKPVAGLSNLDFVVTNPPFHDEGDEDRTLGQTFIRRAAEMLHTGGTLWIVANRHLPYEGELAAAFARVTPHGAGGYKVFEARK